MTDTMQLLVSALCPARHSYLAEWSRVKGLIILLVSSIAMSLVAEVLTDNIQPVLQDFGVTEVKFIMTLTSIYFHPSLLSTELCGGLIVSPCSRYS
jgi:Ca2+/H+ antiporter